MRNGEDARESLSGSTLKALGFEFEHLIGIPLIFYQVRIKGCFHRMRAHLRQLYVRLIVQRHRLCHFIG